MANLTTALHHTDNASVATYSSTASSSASTCKTPYDVFINHRGPDVKKTFASHLYGRLLHHRLRVFLDKEELEEGHKIFSQIEQAIYGASVHIAILSSTYAESSWCLNELVLMKNSGATILPIFFNVDPCEVRHTVKKGVYAEALRKLEEKRTSDRQTGEEQPRYASDTIQNWRTALSYVADLSGFELKSFNGDEGELLNEVLQRILSFFSKRPMYVTKYLTGLDLTLEDFEKTVLQEEAQVKPKVVGIVGVGGIGKTTLAKEFFNRKRSNYNESSFLCDVREKSLNYLQSKLIEELKLRIIEIECPDDGTGIIGQHPLSKALIILDDVNDADQLDVLLPIKNSLSPESLILVTSRDKHVFKSLRVSESSLYNLNRLNIPQSKELFCSYAFDQPFPLPEFADLVDLFVTACNGLPLSLKVIGALVCGQNDRSYWEEQLDRLQHKLPTKIEGSLRISYDSLDKEDQSIFLDIACFFTGEYIDKAIRIWGKVGLQNLQDKCLLEVDSENKINMHDHIRDLGRIIAKEVSMPRRIYSTANITDDLPLQQSSLGITEVRGFTMVNSSTDFFRNTERGDINPNTTSLERRDIPNTTSLQIAQDISSMVSDISSMFSSATDFFSNTKRGDIRSSEIFHNIYFPGMRNLQFVATVGGYLEEILTRVQSPHLLWLRWYGCSDSNLPDWIPMKKLKVLEVEGSRLNTLWPHQSQAVPLDLRELNIWAPLSDIPKSIGLLKKLERIAIWNHSNAVTVERLPDEFCHLRSLKYLVFKEFSRMVSLPVSFGELTNLQHIDLEGASSLLRLPNSFGNLSRLKHLSLRGCENLAISNETLGNIRRLEYFDLSSCRQVNELPLQVAHQLSLQKLYLRDTKLKELPSFIGDLRNLEILELGSALLGALPLAGLSDLKNLKSLSLSSSPHLKCLPDCIGLLVGLTRLVIEDCGIEYLPQEILKMNSLEYLAVQGCPLRELPFKRVEGEIERILSIEGEKTLNKLSSSNDRCMFGLKRLELSDTEIREVFFDEVVLPHLQRLSLSGCSELRQTGWLSGLRKPRDLDISSCVNVEKLPGLETFIFLKRLVVRECEKLERLQGLAQLKSLRTLNVRGCRALPELPGVECLTSLVWLSVNGCEKLRSIPGLGQLTKLTYLDVRRCLEIQELPGVECLTILGRLLVSRCEKLRSIPGLGQLTKLKYLDVRGCREIQELPGVECLTSLKWLSVSGCEKLGSIPGLGQLTKLTHLDVGGCPEIQELPGVECLTSLEQLSVCGCEKLRSIPGLVQLTKLTHLDVRGCREIQELPGVECLTSLERLIDNGCEKLRSIPGLGQLSKLTHLDVGGCRKIQELPGVECLTSLKQLSVCGCEKLRSIPGLGQLTKLRHLDVGGCRKIPELPGVECLTSVRWLSVKGCEKLRSISGLGQLTKLRHLDVGGCREIQEVPGVECLTSLLWLSVNGCEKLRSIPGLGQLTKLTYLDVCRCLEIQELPGVECLTILRRLLVSRCEKLRSIPGLGQLTKLKYLDVRGCREIQELPGVECLTSLEWLSVKGCEKLRSIAGLGQLTKLTFLDVNGCREIQELPGVECLTSMDWLSVKGCEKLRSIPGLGQLTKLRKLDVSQCRQIQELTGVEYLTSLEQLRVSGCVKLKRIGELGQLTMLRELYVKGCREIKELPSVEHLMSLEILDVLNCPKLQWGEGVIEQLRQQLKEGLRYEKRRKRWSCL